MIIIIIIIIFLVVFLSKYGPNNIVKFMQYLYLTFYLNTKLFISNTYEDMKYTIWKSNINKFKDEDLLNNYSTWKKNKNKFNEKDLLKSVIHNIPSENNENIVNETELINTIKNSKKNTELNPYFVENQYHKDYQDTFNAFMLIMPNKKQLFNRSNMPIINISTPSKTETNPLIANFIKEVNRVLDLNVDETYLTRDWKANHHDCDYKSGWEKQQEKLGVPGSIYIKPASKQPIYLVKLEHAKRMEIEDEIRYEIIMVVQKNNAQDQMLIKVLFHIDKQDVNLDREFFDKKEGIETLVKIEDIFVMGFYTKHSFGKPSVRNQFYDFNGITDSRIFSQKQIMNILNKKRKQYEKECIF